MQSRKTCKAKLCDVSQPWSFDMWSLGAIFLEIIVGYPMWLSLKSRVPTSEGRNIFVTGLFSCTGRDNLKIRDKQLKVIKTLPKVLSSGAGVHIAHDRAAVNLLCRMLAWDP